MTRLHKDMTRQQVFDALAAASLAGEFPAWDAKRGQCMYRTADGRACAVGMFMPDGHPACHRLGSIACLFADYDMSAILPDWMDRVTAVAVQDAHDDAFEQTDPLHSWSHAGFVDRLRAALALDTGD